MWRKPQPGHDGLQTIRRLHRRRQRNGPAHTTLAKGTFTPDVLSDIGSFGGLFRVPQGECDEPVLVAAPTASAPS